MKQKFVDTLTNFVIKNKEVDDKQKKIIRYGLEGLYLSLTKMLVIIIMVLLTHSFIEFSLLFVAYIFLRRYSFGLHANSSLICWIVTLPIYVGGSLLIKYCNINIYLVYIIWFLAFISFVLWAPADTPKRPLIRANLRKKQKIKTCTICFIYLIIIFFINNPNVIDAIALALLIQMIVINPLTYKITKTQFNNYRFYPNKV